MVIGRREAYYGIEHVGHLYFDSCILQILHEAAMLLFLEQELGQVGEMKCLNSKSGSDIIFRGGAFHVLRLRSIGEPASKMVSLNLLRAFPCQKMNECQY